MMRRDGGSRRVEKRDESRMRNENATQCLIKMKEDP